MCHVQNIKKLILKNKSKMSFSLLRFGQFCDFRLKVCFSASGSKRFVNSIRFSLLSQGYSVFFVNLKSNSVFFTLSKKMNTSEKD
ncbi:hypothetical protein Hanom_Chr08g00755971 [Helianthus anomalus]